jgi:hypothetical protein
LNGLSYKGDNDMPKVFEDYFSELQADMVSICLEYVEKRADAVFIYCSFEDKTVSCDFFYGIGGVLVERHKLNTLPQAKKRQWDISLTRQNAVLRILNEDVQKLIALCKEHRREMPSEIKLLYNVAKNSLEAKYEYGVVYSSDPDRGPEDVVEEWFAELSAQ